MKSGQIPGSFESFSRTRRALAQPRFLLASMALVVSGVAYLATAQTGRAPVKMTSAPSAAATDRSASLKDLPSLVAAYGKSRQPQSAAMGGFSASAIGTGQSGYNLIETDLTANSPSDEREPAYSPNGDLIAFMSTGKDANNDGKIDSDGVNRERRYHIWIMSRDGKNMRQVTGLNTSDITLSQSHPAWAPDGNQLVYVNNPGANSQLFVVGVNSIGQTSAPEQRTFFAGEKRSPVWSPNGLSIAFACKQNLDGDSTSGSSQFDIFSIPPDSGSTDGLLRLTGGINDPVGNKTQDLNPTYAVVNTDIMYFSSDRDATGKLSGGGRRIWRMTSDGNNKVPVTDPTQRAAGTPSDIDDYPTVSLDDTITERVAFQSNTSLSSTDNGSTGARDYNIWSIALSSQGAGSAFSETEPRVFASDFSGGNLPAANPLTSARSVQPFATISGVENPEGVVVQGQYVYVANRGTSQILRFDQETGQGVPGSQQAGSSFSSFGSVPDAAGMISDGQYFYVASGIGSGVNRTTAIYRFSATTGGNAGFDPNSNSAAFSNGEDAAGKVTNGTEGLAFSAGNNSQFIYASIYSDNKINVYDRGTGQFITTIVKDKFPAVPNPVDNVNKPSGPTGLTFGPDQNSDGFPDLYVNASAADDVLVYAGPNPNDIQGKVGVNQTQSTGQYLKDIVTDSNGTQTNLNAPEGIYIAQKDANNYYLYVSSFQNQGGVVLPGSGDHINRYQFSPNSPGTATPAPRNGVPDGTITNDAAWVRFEGAQGVGYFDFNVLAKNSLGSDKLTVATPTPIPPTTAALETSGEALVVTNILSSQENYDQSGIAKSVASGRTDNVGQDKADDLEPNFSRTSATADLASRLIFSSTRRYPQTPESNATQSDGQTPSASNPYGVQVSSSGTVTQGTADIWGSATQDTTPPILIPQGGGNQPYPVVAPSPDAPFYAPRTWEEGLRAGGTLQLAVVISDLESGLDTTNITKLGAKTPAVTATFRLAGAENFGVGTSKVDINKLYRTATELPPSPFNGYESIALQPYDDGPLAVGGHERQAGAVAGDGNYYCYRQLKAPVNPGDFYMDINVQDQAPTPNKFVYDNIYGFSTKQFPIGGSSDLFVSDYTAGQRFPRTLKSQGRGDSRFALMVPVESYWLSNPEGVEVAAGGAVSRPETFDNVDTWRTLCRGPVPTATLNRYGASDTRQLDPNETKPGKDGPFTETSRVVVVANRSIIWAAPYAGTAFAGPGTIVDADTQTNLTAFLDNGGRLFLSGRDVARALSNDGTVTNSTFLQQELAANYESEKFIPLQGQGEPIIDFVSGGDFISNKNNEFPRGPAETPFHAGYEDLEVPRTSNPQQTFLDAAVNQDPYSGASGAQVDVISPVAGTGITTTASYKAGGSLVGQRVEKVRASGRISRVVFFSFGLEAVNRRYRNATTNNPLEALNTRNIIARNIRQYFKTGSLTGTVTNDKSNQPIAGFLVLITSNFNGKTYLVRSETDGTFTISGLVPGSYTARPAYVLNGKLVVVGTAGAQTSPTGFFGGTVTGGNGEILGGQTTGGFDLRPQPFEPGSLRGTIVTSQGTPSNFGDDANGPAAKRVGVPVLVRSVEENSSVPGGGRFAQLTKTDTAGKFVFTQVPSGVELEVIINPSLDDATTKTVDENDIPAESNLRRIYADNPAENPDKDGYQGPRLDIGRRMLPDSRYTSKVIAPIGDTFFLNDPDPVKYPNPDTGPAAGSADSDTITDSGVPIVVPEGAPVSGILKLNGVLFAGAQIDLLDSKGQPLVPPRSTKTLADGSYNFNDVVTGSYLAHATVTVAGVTLKPQNKVVNQTARMVNRNYTGAKANFSFFIAQVSGRITVNGQPAAKALVKLYYTNDNVFRPERKATTDANGMYTLLYVPAGDYHLRAVLGTASGTRNVHVTASPPDVTNQDINLVSREVSGSVKQSSNGGTAVALPGVTVNLLNSSGTSVGNTTTDAQGAYKFTAVSAGTYSVRATYQGQDKDSASFTVSASSTTVPTIVFYVQTVNVTVLNAQGAVQSGASVSLNANGTPVQSGTTNSQGKIAFSGVSAGTYDLVATFNDLRGNATVTVTQGQTPAPVTIKMVKDSTGVTTYSGNGKIFYISIPYEDGNNPSSNNGANASQPATTSIQNAFTVPPFDSSGQQNYLLQKYNPLTNQFETLDNNASIERGAGYILQVLRKGTNQQLPATDPTRVALTNHNYDKTYTVTLRLNPSARDATGNGRNLIGFGFDPARFSSVDWATASVTHPNGTTVTSIAEAARRGWIVNQITTSQYNGNTLTTVAVSQLKPFIGYSVQTKVDGLKVTFKNPTVG